MFANVSLLMYSDTLEATKMNHVLKKHDMKKFNVIKHHQNKFLSVSDAIVPGGSWPYIEEPYTNDHIGIVLPYRKTAQGIQIYLQHRTLPCWGGIEEETPISFYAPYIDNKLTMVDSTKSVIERKLGLDIGNNIEYIRSAYIYPKLATKAHFYILDVTDAKKKGEPTSKFTVTSIDNHTESQDCFIGMLVHEIEKKNTVVEIKKEFPLTQELKALLYSGSAALIIYSITTIGRLFL